MIVVRVELHSARDHSVTELARMHICNDETGNLKLRNYEVRTLKGRSKAALDANRLQRQASVKNWPSISVHVWNLVQAALTNMGYGRKGGAE